MQGKRPLGRKKKVVGKADESSMQVHGSGTGQGPVGSQDGYQERKEQQQAAAKTQQSAAKTQQSSNAASQLASFFGAARPQQGQQTSQQQARPQQQRPTNAGSAWSAQRPTAGNTSSAQRPTGNASSAQRPAGTQQTSQQSSQRASSGSLLGSLLGGGGSGGGGGKILIIVVIVAVLLLGGSGGLSGLFGGGGDSGSGSGLGGLVSSLTSGNLSSLAGSFLGNQVDLGSLASSVLGSGAASQLSTTSSSSGVSVRNGVLDETVASGSRAKFTKINKNGSNTVTIMVYMCGADLESKSAMGTKDLQEMAAATYGDDVRVIVYTGGSTAWHVKGISNSVNQIYQVKNKGLVRLEENMGNGAMTNPDTLVSFIQYCKQRFSANRYALILWDHGCGSVSGYGYDEKNPSTPSMSLANLNKALKQGGVQFDFIGFDACLMATVETALMASNYADYLIASEETEPGIGWYYTNWLTALGSDPGMSTLKIGQQICDDFVTECNSKCRGQKTTLSVVDLAELANTVPSKLTSFSKSITSLISQKDYKTVSNARNGSREFAANNRIDQVDLTDLCYHMDTKESQALATALRGAVKYNRINNIADAHGLSVYFPYQKVSNVEKAAQNYAAIGMDASYADAIRAFAKVEASGQAVTGGTNSPVQSLFGGSYSSASSEDMVSQLLSAFLGGGRSVEGLTEDNRGFLTNSAMSKADLAQYLSKNLLDPSKLVFKKDGNDWVLDLTVDQWALVSDAVQNVFYKTSAGYVDLGLDTLFSFDDKYRMVADMDGTWLGINGQPVPYYVEGLEETGAGWYYTGRVPALLDGDRVDLMVSINADTGDAFISGIRFTYVNGETETIAKAFTVSEVFSYMEEYGDSRTELPLQFLADLYDNNQNFIDSYAFGNATVLTRDGAEIGNIELPDASKMLVTYRFTDIYNQHYWTPVIGK